MNRDKYDANARHHVARLMVQTGGGFAGALGDAWFHADPNNRQRLESAFPEIFEDFERRQAMRRGDS